MRLALKFLVLLGALLVPDTSHAAYPCNVVKIVTPVAGGQTIPVGHLMAQKLSGILGVSTVLEQKAGAGGSLGVMAVLNAPADGCNVLYAIGSALTLPYYADERRPYDAERDLEPIDIVLEVAPAVLLGQLGTTCTFASFKERALATPRLVDIGANNQTFAQLARDMLLGIAKIPAVPVQYQSEPSALRELIGGHVQYIVVLAPTALPAVESRQACAILQIANERNKYLHDIPSLQDVGLHGPDFRIFNGLMVPKSTPKAVVDELKAAVATMKRDPDFIAKLRTELSEPTSGPGFAAWLREITPAYRQIGRTYAPKG